ncbi:Response regulator receiver domain-containing protein [Butyrivibrio proteoclasticus]|uniref:Stage 0 sporulation protein A homolog n=1 Tax=Butyrivibrio proteoclasticus TaxID=43305 RepID=A0A1I5T9E9_9FIRM|nr:response regulator [Butyrivibrio proteoclasticus]SFP79670.1 Response regulator receiver domain-containing protein [Butyrivibrio proteoclasticus]
MEKKAFLIGHTKSFMVNAIVVGLQKENYEVISVAPNSKAIKEVEDKPSIYLLYLGDTTIDDVDLFKYLNEAIDTERFMLYLIGNRDELTLALSYIAKEKVQETYLRPLDVKLLAEHLDSVVEYSAVDESLRKKILIIDDDGTMLRMMKTWLSVKYHVYMASSGKIALSFLAQNPVDLILLDYEMPVMSGPEVLKEIRGSSKLKHTPVIFLTAKDDKESVMKVVNLKPEKYLLKSMPKEKLTGAIDDFLRSRK